MRIIQLVLLLWLCLPLPTYGAIQDRWLFDEGTGTATTADSAGGNNTGTLVTMEVEDWVAGILGTALLFDGAGEEITTTVNYSNPTVYSLVAWFKTTSTAGRPILAFQSTQTGASAGYDRILYIGQDSKVRYGVGVASVIASTGTYTDGQWHCVIATQNGASAELFVNNVSQGTASATPPNTSGWWRIAGSRLSAWPQGTDGTFAGTLDTLEIYDHVLSPGERATLCAVGAARRRRALFLD